MERAEYAYLERMEDLKTRLQIAEAMLDQAQASGPDLAHHDLIVLQLRKILELIAFGSLIANQDQYTATYLNYASHWNAKRLLENLRSINADFYPKPIELVPGTTGAVKFEYLTADYLTEDDFVELYGRASAALHTPNPFAPPSEAAFGRSFRDWLNRIIMLMRLHQIKLLTVRQHWIVILASEQHARAALLAAVEVVDEV